MSQNCSVDRPVFFVGMGRSGTTIIFESLARHPDLAWPSNYCEWMPRYLFMNALVPVVDFLGLRGHKKQYSRAIPGNRYLPQPDEAYAFWDYYSQENFSRSYLTGVTANRETVTRLRCAVSDLVRWQGKRRFSAKLTGPGRIGFLASVFPDACFIHIIRDGRSVVESLLRQDFWRDKGGLDKPFWEGTPGNILQQWEASGRDSDVLTALQWRYVIESIQEEKAALQNDAYMEIRYEDFVQNPDSILHSIYNFCNLDSTGLSGDLPAKPSEGNKQAFRNMNEKWKNMDSERLNKITAVMQPLLGELGYE